MASPGMTYDADEPPRAKRARIDSHDMNSTEEAPRGTSRGSGNRQVISQVVVASNSYLPPILPNDDMASPVTPVPAHTNEITYPFTSPIADVWNKTPLPKDPKKIRLLKLHGGDGQDINATLIVRNGQEKYEALSYTWGTEEATSVIQIYAGEEIYKVNITPSLASALRQLRLPRGPRLLWIDQLCINQSDHSEKTSQVPNMASIYNEAFNVCVWLGDDTKNNAETALRFVKRILDLDEFERLVESAEFAEDWKALFDLMTRPWFSRRWVIQEIALAKRATIYCGQAPAVKWRDFANAVALFGSRHRQISGVLRASSAFHNAPDILGDVTALGAHRLVQESSNLFRKSDDGKIQEHLLPLETLVSTLSPFEATEPHDTIYAVLSLAEDTGAKFSVKPAAAPAPEPEPPVDDEPETPLDLNATQRAQAEKTIKVLRRVKDEAYPVDYNKTFFEACKDFLSFTIRNSRSLDMICRPWAPDTGEEFPSWIRTLSGVAFRAGFNKIHSRVNADTLVGLPATGKRKYNAARNFPLGSSWRLGKAPQDKSLFVKGFVLDSIKVKKVFAQQGNVPQEWLEMAGWKDTSASLPPDAFWRTLVADRGHDGGNPPLYWQLACKQAYAQRPTDDDLNTEKLMTINSRPKAVAEKVVVEYLHRVQAVVWMRRLMLTTEQKILGLVPAKAKKNDLICILAGCSVPVVLRKVDGDKLKGEVFYTLIGECYVHGMMDGEASRVLERKRIAKELDVQEFELI
jgi:hypothetical protein